jgi:lipooligosaccharide transport system ATP-binding protein
VSDAIVSLVDVSKHFGARTAVDSVRLDVPAGACFGLLGPNGAGKTTTLRMIYGVTRPSSGTVSVFGIDVQKDPRAVRRRLGVTLQENCLVETLSPEDNLRVFGRYHLLREPELSRRVEELMDFLDLRSHARVPVRNLSGGFQRRVAIALSLINRPSLLILDEPTTGLDPAVRQALWERIRSLRRGGTTVLLTTHYMDEAERLCDEVAIFNRGRIESQGSPQELIERHLAREALELDCPPEAETAIFGDLGPLLHLRSGNRLIVYAADVAPLLEKVHRAEGPLGTSAGRAIVRPTNLEDVFLALTGMRMEEPEA